LINNTKSESGSTKAGPGYEFGSGSTTELLKKNWLPNPGPDPQSLNPDQIRIRIHSPGKVQYSTSTF
jgi:hypothetical protein